MIPENIAIVFMVLPLVCFIYIFRGISSDENPIWGNIIAAGLSFVVCGMVAVWLSQGTIVSPTIVGNSTYQLSSDVPVGELVQEQANISQASYNLGTGGTGMFIRSSISGSQVSTNESVITVHTYDIVYNQYIDAGLTLLYMLGAALSFGLLVWFVIDMRRALQEQDEYEENNYGDYS